MTILKKYAKYSNAYKLLTGRITTNIADSLFYMAVLWYFKEHGHSPIMISLIFTISAGIDMISFSFGPLIDRISIKKLLKYATIIQILISILVAVILYGGTSNFFIDFILLIIFSVSTIVSSIIYPAEYKLLPIFVSKNDLLHFNGLFQVSYKVLDLILDGATTLIITLTSINSTIIFSALVFSIALIIYNALKINNSAKNTLQDDEFFTGSYFSDLALGWQTLKKEKTILELILPLCAINFFMVYILLDCHFLLKVIYMILQ